MPFERKEKSSKMGSGQMMPELGSRISLISKADIRYEGRLFTVDPQECTIALANGECLVKNCKLSALKMCFRVLLHFLLTFLRRVCVCNEKFYDGNESKSSQISKCTSKC